MKRSACRPSLSTQVGEVSHDPCPGSRPSLLGGGWGNVMCMCGDGTAGGSNKLCTTRSLVLTRCNHCPGECRGERGDAAAAVACRRYGSSSRRRSSRVWRPAAARIRDGHQRRQRWLTAGGRQVATGAGIAHSQVRGGVGGAGLQVVAGLLAREGGQN